MALKTVRACAMAAFFGVVPSAMYRSHFALKAVRSFVINAASGDCGGVLLNASRVFDGQPAIHR
jgi:hypothetical protein